MEGVGAAALTTLTALTSLDLSDHFHIFDEGAVALPSLTALQRLENCQVHDKGVALSALTQVGQLDLMGMDEEGARFDYLQAGAAALLAPLTRLTSFNLLFHEPAGGEIMLAVARLLRLQSLQLEFGGGQDMSELVTLPCLRNLTLAGFTVSNDSAAALATLSRLKLLDLN